MSYLSITLKLRKPGKEKQRIMDEAMINYTRAFDFLLNEARSSLTDIEKNYSLNAHKLSKWVDKDLSKRLNQFQVEPFKDSLKLDFAMTLESYLKLKAAGNRVRFPSSYIDSAGNLIRIRPIFFCRYDMIRDYCLLYQSDKGRYYVKLYLLNHQMSRRNQDRSTVESKLEYIHKSHEKLESKDGKERFIIVPLSFGKWQENYLNECLNNPEILKTARLLKRQDDYYLTINMKPALPKMIETETWMGIARGFEQPLHYTVTDQMGQITDFGTIKLDKADGSNEKYLRQEIYQAANQIVSKAQAYHAQVILENIKLHRAGNGSNSENERPILEETYYRSLDKILTYKLESNGLPKPIRVSPSGILYTCPQCGKISKKSRASKDMFLCISCGSVYKIDPLGSLNLANRVIKYHHDDIKIKVLNHTKGIYFTNDLLGLRLKVSSMEGYMEALREEIIRIVKEIKEDQNLISDRELYLQRWSMVQKIESYDDFMMHIRLLQ